jgi:acyl-CoA synthetase (NDP forming)
MESIGDGRRLMQVARKSHKPILAFKSNIGKLGQNIALSHTASLTSDDKVVDAAFHQAGMLRVRDATSLGNNLKILELPPMKGKRVGVISRSGGHAVIAADACELCGFDLAPFPDSFLREIEKHFRASVIRLTNPLDLGDLFDLELYAKIIEQTLQLEQVDGVVFLHTSLSAAEDLTSRSLLERIIQLVDQYKKPVAYYLSANATEVNYLKQNYHYPIFNLVVETVRALEMSQYYYEQYQKVHDHDEIPIFKMERSAVSKLLDEARGDQRSLLLDEALTLLEHCGIPTVASVAAAGQEEALAAAEKIGYPVAIKIISSGISHKSDVGGVQLNLRDAAALQKAYEEMLAQVTGAFPEAKIDGVLVQPMASGGRELILGGRQDPQFGPVVLVGLGGIFVEVFEEVVVRVAPISRREAHEMVQSLRGYAVLAGARGSQPADIPALEEALLRLSQLLSDFPEIKELDINPLRVFQAGAGCRALDARVIL